MERSFKLQTRKDKQARNQHRASTHWGCWELRIATQATNLQSNTIDSADIAVPQGDSGGDIKGARSDALIEGERQCWKTRIRYVLFDAVDLLPHPPLLCLGS